MRLFLAIDLPKTVKEDLAILLQSIQEEYRYFNWVPTENYHLTVQFFGEVAEEKVDPLSSRISECIYDIEPFDICLRSAGIFIKNSVAMYINLYRQKQLEYLVRRIKDDLGAKDIKKYLPHVTIARWKIPSKQQYFLIKKKLQAMRIDLSFTVDHLFLYQSVSHKHHPVYKKLRQFDLQ